VSALGCAGSSAPAASHKRPRAGASSLARRACDPPECNPSMTTQGPSGWLVDPTGRHRVRYWDGAAWTAWVADGAEPFVEEPQTDGATDTDRVFWSPVFLVGGSFWLFVWGAATAVVLTNGPSLPGLVIPCFWFVTLVVWLRTPYRATARSDGSVIFKSLTRSTTTTTQAISRVSHRRRGWVFHFDDRSASLGVGGAQGLSRYLRERNPHLDID
jgi:Protein of unknown function (DUF2510)